MTRLAARILDALASLALLILRRIPEPVDLGGDVEWVNEARIGPLTRRMQQAASAEDQAMAAQRVRTGLVLIAVSVREQNGDDLRDLKLWEAEHTSRGADS